MNRFDFLEFETSGKASRNASVPMPDNLRDGPDYYRAAQGMRASGHFYAAAQLYEKALGFDAHHHLTWVELIDSLVRAGKLAEADTQSQRALAMSGQVHVFYAARALVLAYANRLPEAVSHAEMGMQARGDAWYTRCAYAEVLVRKNRRDAARAVALVEQAADMTDNPWEVYFLAGWAFLHARLAAHAAALYAEAAHFNPKAPCCWLGLGDAFRALRLYDQAVFYYRRAAELEPDNEIALRRQAAVLPNLFGLMQGLFAPTDLRRRWQKRLERLNSSGEPPK